jgi:hypothetical protein
MKQRSRIYYPRDGDSLTWRVYGPLGAIQAIRMSSPTRSTAKVPVWKCLEFSRYVRQVRRPCPLGCPI